MINPHPDEIKDIELQNKMKCDTTLRCIDCKYYDFKIKTEKIMHGDTKNYDEICNNPKLK